MAPHDAVAARSATPKNRVDARRAPTTVMQWMAISVGFYLYALRGARLGNVLQLSCERKREGGRRPSDRCARQSAVARSAAPAESGVAFTRSASASGKEPKKTQVAPREELRQRDGSEALARGSGVWRMEDKVAQDHGKRSWNAASAREAGQRIRLAQGATRGVRRTSRESAAGSRGRWPARAADRRRPTAAFAVLAGGVADTSQASFSSAASCFGLARSEPSPAHAFRAEAARPGDVVAPRALLASVRLAGTAVVLHPGTAREFANLGLRAAASFLGEPAAWPELFGVWARANISEAVAGCALLA